MSVDSEILPLKEIIAPKPHRPNLVENIREALADPVRTLRDYLFTPGIAGYFERFFRDVKEGRGGGYWVQAEYGGGKTHFLSALLCLLGESGDETEAEVWSNVSHPELRETWEKVIRPRRLLRAHMTLMGTGSAVGGEHSRLVDLIDDAIVKGLESEGIEDPGIRAGDEVLDWFGKLDPAIRSAIEGTFKDKTGLLVEAHRREYDYSVVKTARAVIEAAAERKIIPNVDVNIKEHFLHVLERLRVANFGGLLIVIDEYYSRQAVLNEKEAIDDEQVIETIGSILGRSEGKPIYLVVASQAEMPAKLSQRIDPMVLLRDEEKEYRQIVCKRIMDYKETIAEQSTLYHSYYSRNFQFLRRSTEDATREIFPFQSAVFRFLRDMVGSDRVHLPSTRFAIGVAYDSITAPGALDNRRFMTRADLLVGDLERDLLKATETQDAAAALRQARDYVDNVEWPIAPFHPMAHRVLNHLFLDSVIGGQGQTVDQIVEGTLVQDERGMLPARQIAKTIVEQMRNCPQIEVKGETWRFAVRITEGEQFETILQRAKRAVAKTDPRIQEKWRDLLTAAVSMTGGTVTYLSGLVTPISVLNEYCGIQYQTKAIYAPRNLQTHIGPLERLVQAERVRIVVVPEPLPNPPAITDPAVAVVAPGPLTETAIDEVRGIIACGDIREEYRIKTESGTNVILAATDVKERDLLRSLIPRQRETYREGEIYTRDGLTLNTKQLFKDTSVNSGLSAVAQQLVRSAYDEATKMLRPPTKKTAMATADAAKVFDALFGGVTDAKSKGAAEAFGPVLGLSTVTEPLKITANAGPGPDAVAAFIRENEECHAADVYGFFCEEPYGLPAEVVDLLVLGCVFLSSPYPLELRPPASVSVYTRENRPFNGPIRAAQLRHLTWPRSLKGYRIVRSKETTWNDIVGIALAIDPDKFGMSTDHAEIERQQEALRDRLGAIGKQAKSARDSIEVLGQATGETPSPDGMETLARLQALADLSAAFTRGDLLQYANETWGEDPGPGITRDLGTLGSLMTLVGDTLRLSARLSWFRQLVASAPEGMNTDIEMTKPLVTLEQLMAGSGQIAAAVRQLDELWAKFMSRFRSEHAEYVKWATAQQAALARAETRLPTLVRLNRLSQLGPPAIPQASQDLERVRHTLQVCDLGEELDVGNGTSCLHCHYEMAKGDSLHPVGERAEEIITGAIDGKARLLSQGLIAEAIKSAGDKDLLAILAAVQAGNIKKIVDDDLLTDELVKRLASVLAKARQQTVATITVHEYLTTWRYVTRDSLDSWLQGLRQVLEASLTEAKKGNPGKTITLLLKEGDE